MSNKTKMERDGIRYAKMHSKGVKTDNLAQERGIMSEHKDHDWEITSREAGGEWWKCRVCGELFFLDYDEIR